MDETPVVTAVEDPRTIEEMLKDLAMARAQANFCRLRANRLLDFVLASNEYQDLKTRADDWNKQAEELTAKIKAQAVEGFDGNKHPLPGVEIQEKNVAILTDEVQGRKYAIEQAPKLVSVDWKGLEKIAVKLAGTPAELRFYDVQKVPVATIATDLSKYLPAEPEQKPADEIPF